MVVFGAEGRWFESHSSRHVGTLGKSFTRGCLYDVAPCVAALRLNSTPIITCYHSFILYLCVRLYILSENIIFIIIIIIIIISECKIIEVY